MSKLFEPNGNPTVYGLNQMRSLAQASVETAPVDLRNERGAPFISRCWYEAIIAVITASYNRDELIDLVELFPEAKNAGQGAKKSNNY